jgi:hypothetical protein
MSNAFYGKGRQAFAEGSVPWLTANIKSVLVDAAQYTVAIDTHQFLSDIPSGARIATSPNMTGKSTTLGVLNVANFAWAAVSGLSAEIAIWYLDTGTASTSPLLLYIDTATGLPVTPNGGDINWQTDTGANKLAKL